MKCISQELHKKTSMFYELSGPFEGLLILPTGPTELTTQVLSVKFYEQECILTPGLKQSSRLEFRYYLI